MKKGASRTRCSRAKAHRVPGGVDEYLASVSEPARSTLNEVRRVIRSVVPADVTEVISYRIPAFKHGRIVVWYAAFSDHCSLFPTASVIARFKEELRGYTISKGTIQFAVDKPLPVALLKKVIKARLAEMD